ncbi:hypothetical protein M4I32_02365 [Microbacterium sp. LRZ72]|uniref:hypothetical protein n=1 Tax=Microbacterium sp. LRZ72 TaxID=2942481 RepID=UPI0029B3320B|nr:hypothetical protein [Microbacterium sp. LRZ72]MDX2375641.1 hypothetical protein [Microbacterium sp. LRZ72]
MTEHEPQPRPAAEAGDMDWRRLEVTLGRFTDHIAEGLSAAIDEHREIDDLTARTIAHALGRGYGRTSHLADFGRTGEGRYEDLRDEYLQLYTSDHIDAPTKELIDWLGTYLVNRENASTDRRFMNEHLPPTLDRLLVPTTLTVRGQRFLVHVSADHASQEIAELEETLAELDVDRDDALQAFLSLPDVNAAAENIMERFHEMHAGTFIDIEDALRALSPLVEWEDDLAEWAIDHGIEPEALKFNLEPLADRLRGIYDLVEWKERLHAFIR